MASPPQKSVKVLAHCVTVPPPMVSTTSISNSNLACSHLSCVRMRGRRLLMPSDEHAWALAAAEAKYLGALPALLGASSHGCTCDG
mmetsp:Transcript_52937/g.133759  ORF Transcript_52937/g.133759 Transcript_52937/m.133759 type:complete len:86 (-) Transcript_52937:867-1124(-)